MSNKINHSKEIERDFLLPGWPFLILGIVTLPFFCIGFIFLKGLVLVNPNQSAVLLFFGKYVGTIRRPGLFFVNPLVSKNKVSLRINNFNSESLKVNDLRGNPIEIGAVVVWRVKDTAQASFDVENYTNYVAVQSESALRTTAARHPYDTPNEGQTSLRGDSEEVNQELESQLTERLSLAGVEVLEVRISHLAYAPEIAGVMLRRQQAEAIIDARIKIVEGAVGMVQMALDQIDELELANMDDKSKNQLISNLLVVLCWESDTSPVINAGSS